MSNSIIHLPNLDYDKEYIISKKNIDKKPNFTMIGNKMKALDVIANFTKPEAMTFIHLKDNRDYETNYVKFSTSKLSKTDKVVFSNGFKALKEKDLVVRVKKGATSTYMFNPDFIIPTNYKEAKVEWLKLKEGV